ncbi:MAG: N-acetylmuramoyl-L-alanine amidase [Firmicutes bacterium]|nr:N-acetylmuramoyl-L-alanine amidase [Bacillota bacterium]
MEITRMYLTPNKYSRPQIPLKRVTKIAVHYVGNAGSSAAGNRNYFESLKNGQGIYASSHYIIGLDGEIIQCIPENEWSYATNDLNCCSISIENCHPKADGKFTEQTQASLTELCADLCKRYSLDPMKDIVRHYDVTGKFCPLWWVKHPQEFVKFKRDVEKVMKGAYIDMDELKKLKEEIQGLRKEIEDSREKYFENLDDVPEWGRETVKKLVEKGALKGDGQGIDISYAMLRMLVINDRAGIYG